MLLYARCLRRKLRELKVVKTSFGKGLSLCTTNFPFPQQLIDSSFQVRALQNLQTLFRSSLKSGYFMANACGNRTFKSPNFKTPGLEDSLLLLLPALINLSSDANAQSLYVQCSRFMYFVNGKEENCLLNARATGLKKSRWRPRRPETAAAFWSPFQGRHELLSWRYWRSCGRRRPC